MSWNKRSKPSTTWNIRSVSSPGFTSSDPLTASWSTPGSGSFGHDSFGHTPFGHYSIPYIIIDRWTRSPKPNATWT